MLQAYMDAATGAILSCIINQILEFTTIFEVICRFALLCSFEWRSGRGCVTNIFTRNGLFPACQAKVAVHAL